MGALFDGMQVYGYRYKGSPAYHFGLMAQDVEKTTPRAVIEINGYKAVDYRAAAEARDESMRTANVCFVSARPFTFDQGSRVHIERP